jgi:hypothetical protein
MPIASLLLRLRIFHILLIAGFTITFFAAMYVIISFYAPSYGIQTNSQPISDGTFSVALILKCMYFSITAFTSLGFSDLTPGDAAKIFVAFEVFCGGITIGLSVAKLVLIGSDDLTTAQSKCLGGYWIDRVTTSPITYGLTRFEHNSKYGIVFFGENYSEGKRHLGGFTSNLAHVDWPRAVFRWEHSDTAEFGEGEARLRFHTAVKRIPFLKIRMEGAAYRYEGISVTLGSAEKLLVEGWRITDRDTIRKLESSSSRPNTVLEIIREYFPTDRPRGNARDE